MEHGAIPGRWLEPPDGRGRSREGAGLESESGSSDFGSARGKQGLDLGEPGEMPAARLDGTRGLEDSGGGRIPKSKSENG